MKEEKTCACVADDAYMCFRLRYPGEVERLEELGLRTEYCTCPCHDENQDDYDEDED